MLYTSDGRDVEMSVASTKAFYAQVAAGFLLAVAIADVVGADGRVDRRAPRTCSPALRDLPDAMDRGARPPRAHRRASPHELAPSRRYWAIVGNGANRIAAQEIRIKLSELCYKSIACDATEDKKHIDLSSEPLILVCAAGLTRLHRRRRGQGGGDLPGPQGGADRDRHRGRGPLRRRPARHRRCRATHPPLAFVLSAMVGHLFGYEAALAIDAQARPLREARGRDRGARRPTAPRSATTLLASAAPASCAAARRPLLRRPPRRRLRRPPRGAHRRRGSRRCCATPSALRAARRLPGRARQGRHARRRGRGPHRRPSPAPSRSSPGRSTPSSTRPRRSPSASPAPTRRCSRCRWSQAVLDAGAPRDRLSYRTAQRSPTSTRRWPRWSATPATASRATRPIDGDAIHRGRRPRRHRARHPAPHRARPRARGHQAPGRPRARAARRPGPRATAARIVIVPEVKDGATTGITLLHVRFHDRLPAATARSVLQGYRGRYAALRDAVTETEPTFREDLLADQPVVDLLTEPDPAPAPTAGAPERAVIVGIGIDEVEVDRFRQVLGRTPSLATRLFTDGEQAYADAGRAGHGRPALRRALRGQGGGDEGARRRARRVPVRRHRGGARTRQSGAPSLALHGTAACAGGRAVRRRARRLTRCRLGVDPRRPTPPAAARAVPTVGDTPDSSDAGHGRRAGMIGAGDAHRDARGDGGDRRGRARAGRGADRPGRRRGRPRGRSACSAAPTAAGSSSSPARATTAPTAGPPPPACAGGASGWRWSTPPTRRTRCPPRDLVIDAAYGTGSAASYGAPDPAARRCSPSTSRPASTASPGAADRVPWPPTARSPSPP